MTRFRLLLMLLGGAVCSVVVAQNSSRLPASTSPHTEGSREAREEAVGAADTLNVHSAIPYIRQAFPWLEAENTAGMTCLPAGSVSVAEVFGRKDNGGFMDYYQSDDALTWGARVESYFRLSARAALYGLVEYDHFTGQDMGGSYFIDPKNAPFDIMEYTDDNRGDKQLERYHLTGAASYDLTHRLALGAKLDYIAANYAKQKDLRHVNELTDLTLTVGLAWRLNQRLTLGANYLYRRRVEGLTLDTYGTTDQVYTSLVSYGAMLGVTEQFGENGYTKENEKKPLFDKYHGASVQIDWSISKDLGFYNQLSYRSRSGYYGRKSPSTVIYSRHDADVWAYTGRLSLHRKSSLHTLDLSYSREDLGNEENIYRYDNEGGGKTNVGYYGTLETTDRTLQHASARYTGSLGKGADGQPVWVLGAQLTYRSRDLTASIYPSYRKQALHQTAFGLSGLRNISLRSERILTLSLDLGYATGGGGPYTDGVYATDTDSEASPKTMLTYLYREYEYMTCPRASLGVAVRYAQRLGSWPVRGYVDVSYDFTRAWDTDYLTGNDRHCLTLTLGCAF